MNATPDPPSSPGRPRTTLGRYDLLTRLGSGGMADVYLAVARGPAGFHKLSVLKVLRPHVAQDDEGYAMFLDEARLSANFSHPNVVHTHGVEEDGGQHFLVMEYLEGRSLAQLHAEQRDLPVPLQLRALTDALHGLHYVHELAGLDGQPYNVVHRDVSPQNVFVTYEGSAKILDFGVAKARNALAHTREGTYKGKVGYMAPEQLLGEAIDRRADVFAAGILLFRALTGRRLWEGLDQLTIMHRLATRVPVPAPRSLRPDVPPALDAACAKALSLRPEDRFDTASELADVLEEYLHPFGAEASHRRLGRFLEERYAAERASFQASVDACLRALRDAPATLPRARGSGSLPPPARSSGATPGSLPPPARGSGSLPPPARGSGSLPPPARGSGATPGSIPAPPPARGSGATPGSIPAPPLPRGFGATPGSIPAPPLPRGFGSLPPPARGSGATPGSIPAPPLARGSGAVPGTTSPPPPVSIAAPAPAPLASAPLASAPALSIGPAPDVTPRRLSAPLVLGALLVVIAAGIAPWLPRLWPRLQATFSPNTLTTQAASPALPSAAPPAPSPPALAVSAPAAAASAPNEAPPAPAASEARQRRREAPRGPGERAPD